MSERTLLQCHDGRMVPPCEAEVLLYPPCNEPGAHFYTNADQTDLCLVVRICDWHWNDIMSVEQLLADISASCGGEN